jgi:hypothetical protein
MKKTGLLLALTFVVLASAAASPANAEVVVGVAVGAPVYVHPVPPYRYLVPRPCAAYVPAPVYARVYMGPAPVYYRYWHQRPYAAGRDFDGGWR